MLVGLNQVGKGNVAVVSPPGAYDDMVRPEHVAAAGGEFGEAPPDYCHGLEDSGFSDAAVRRGEGWKKGGMGRGRKRRARETRMCVCLRGQS